MDVLETLLSLDAISVLTLGVLALAATIFTVAWVGLRVLGQYLSIVQDARKEELDIKRDTAQALKTLSDHDREQLALDTKQLRIAETTVTALQTVDKTTTATLEGVQIIQKSITEASKKMDALPDKMKAELRPLVSELERVVTTLKTFQDESRANVDLLKLSQERHNREVHDTLTTISTQLNHLLDSVRKGKDNDPSNS